MEERTKQAQGELEVASFVRRAQHGSSWEEADDFIPEEELVPKTRPQPQGNKNHGRRRRKHPVKIIFMSLAVLLAIAGGVVAARFKLALDQGLNHLNRKNAVDLDSIKVSPDLENDDQIINILLVGSDKRSTWSETGRSDSTMIASLDTRHDKLKLVSLMRDMYVEIPGFGQNRFNAAYSFGGVELLYQTIAENFGIALDGYVVVDFAAFLNVINKIGGVDVELTQWEYEYLIGAYPQKPRIQLLKPGMNRMSGSQALAYCRIRQDEKGDFGRTQRQRNVLSAIFQKARGLSLGQISELAKEILPDVSTDLTNEEILSYMKTVLFMGTTELDQFRIPVDHSYEPTYIDGMDVLVPDMETNRRELKDFLFEGEEE